MKRYQWLLVDLDNTIFDFDAGKTVALGRLLTELFGEVQPLALRVYRDENKKCWQAVEAGQLAVDAVNLRRISKMLEALDYRGDHRQAADRYIELLAAMPILFEGAEQLLEALARHYKLAAITNGFSNVKRPHLANSQTERFFEHLFISSELGVSKPQPLFFDQVMATLKVERSACLIIGDSLSSDILGGINSAIDTCWYRRQRGDCGDIVPTYTVDNYDQLRELLIGC